MKLSSSRWSLYVLWATCATLLSLLSWHFGLRWGQLLDNAAYDTGFNLRQPPSARTVAEDLPYSRDIVIVDLPHELPRPVLADLVTHLRQARAVALDLMLVDRASQLSQDERDIFEEKGQLTQWKREDKILADAIKKAGNVVVGSWPDVAPNGSIQWTHSSPLFERGARATAHLKVLPDSEDGYVRRLRLWEDDTSSKTSTPLPIPAVSLQVAALATGKSPEQLAPPSGERELYVNYLGPPSVFKGQRVVYPLAQTFWDPEDFKGKLVFVGQTNFRSKDIFDTPYGAMPGLFIHANATATILDENGQPQELPWWVVGMMAFGAGLLIVVPLTRRTLLFCALMALLEIVALWLLVALLWAQWNIVVPLSVPALVVFLTYNGIALYEYMRTRRTLGRVVGRTMLPRLLEAHAEPSLGGKAEVATAFFCDLRGYSEWAQTRTPQQLIDELNAYTSSIVRVVEPLGGRPIDFFGDGVFVLFEGAHHARHAVEAALAVSEVLEAELPSHLRAGVALHTGTMVIGLVGHAQRFKPGAVGEAVNIASRVQALSDDCGFSVLLSRQTLEAWRFDELADSQDELALTTQPVFCGAHTIKGYARTLEVFGLKPLSKTNVEKLTHHM